MRTSLDSTASPFSKLALAHAVGVCGDIFVTVTGGRDAIPLAALSARQGLFDHGRLGEGERAFGLAAAIALAVANPIRMPAACSPRVGTSSEVLQTSSDDSLR